MSVIIEKKVVDPQADNACNHSLVSTTRSDRPYTAVTTCEGRCHQREHLAARGDESVSMDIDMLAGRNARTWIACCACRVRNF
eukprot:13246677-Heterocapsa_arctica.AAC.1